MCLSVALACLVPFEMMGGWVGCGGEEGERGWRVRGGRKDKEGSRGRKDKEAEGQGRVGGEARGTKGQEEERERGKGKVEGEGERG